MKKTCKVMLARFPGGNVEHPDSTAWILKTFRKCLKDPRIEEVINWHKSDTPITMVRNLCVEHAQELGVDYLLMIDNDMDPDEPNIGAKPFWDTSFDFMFDRKSPCIVAAPYVGPDGQTGLRHNNVYAFRWNSDNNNHWPFGMAQYTRYEALQRGGIEKVAAMPTGLMLFDMRIFEKMKKPYFEYEWVDDGPACEHCGQAKPGPRAKKASTEDCFFTREITMGCFDDPDAGVFCNWDAWARHIKMCKLGKPQDITIDMVNKRYRDAVMENRDRHESVREWNVQLPKVKPKKPIGSNGSAAQHEMVVGQEGAFTMVDRDKFKEVLRGNFPEFTGSAQDEI